MQSKKLSLPSRYGLFPGLLILALLTGCGHVIGERRHDTVSVPEERLTQVKAFDWKAMADPQPPDTSDEVVTIDPDATELPLNLNQVRAMVLQNNLDLKVQWFNPKIAEEAVASARAVFEPLAFSSFNFYKSETPTITDLDASSSQSEGWDVGLSIPLSTGGRITVNMPFSRSETDMIRIIGTETFRSDFTSYNNSLIVSLSQPLLRDGGLRTNTHGIRIARYNSLASRARIKLETMNVLALADRVYWRLYAAREELLVRKQEYDLAVAQLERAKRLVKAQTAARIEILRAESAASQRLEGIILAEKTVRDRQRDLKRILNKPGLEMDTPIILVPVAALDPKYIPLDKKRVLDYALENRMELLELELQIATQASTVDLERNRRLPALALNYSYNINGLGESGNEAFDMVLDNDFSGYSVGLSLQVPIGNKAARSRLRQAILRKRQALLTKKQRELTITQEVLGTIDQLNANWQRVLASRKSAQLAQQTLLAEQRQHELGLQTSNEVLSAQTSFANARSSAVRALVEYQIAQTDLAYATGCLLDAARIQWPEMEND